jgi:cytochrome c oxidase subunit 3
MPGATTTNDIELIIANAPEDPKKASGGAGGLKPPPDGGPGGGDSEGKTGRNPHEPSPKRYFTGIAVGIIAILMFFLALASAYLVRRGSGSDWAPVHIPLLLWVNTLVLLLSSATLELARHGLARNDLGSFRNFWLFTTILGIVFLVGQVGVWRQLNSQGIYLATNPASSFFYIFTGAHALHLIGGVIALIYVAHRNFDLAKVTRSVAAEVTSYYWHFLVALWLLLLALLYLAN